MFLPIHTRTPEQVVEYANAYWDGLKEHGHDPKARELGLLIPMHLAATTAEAKARSEAGVMSYFKTILDLRLDYTDWLNRRGVELPARLRTAAGARSDSKRSVKSTRSSVMPISRLRNSKS